jgi:methyltransferase (TIGR00027 family)
MEDPTIQNVSDTALWIAAYRAQESESAHPVFKDPLARKLAGERGVKMVAETPNTKAMGFAMVTRTLGIDELVLLAMQKNIDLVINLGAGLDTRPYRLPLPPGLVWIEVDFPTIIDYKNNLLKNDRPVCQLERIACDLTNDAASTELFRQLGAHSSKALLITEGVLAYLEKEEAAVLAEKLRRVASFKYWIMDIKRGGFRNHKTAKNLNKVLKKTPLKFDHPEPLMFFKDLGWKPLEERWILDVADRAGLKFPAMFPWNLLIRLLPGKIREKGNKTYGYVMLEKG